MLPRCVALILLLVPAAACADRFVVAPRTVALRSTAAADASVARVAGRGTNGYIVFRVLEERGRLLHVEAANTMGGDTVHHCVSGDWALELIALRAWIERSDAVPVTTREVDVAVDGVPTHVAPGVVARSLAVTQWPAGAVGTFYVPPTRATSCVARTGDRPAPSRDAPILGMPVSAPARPAGTFTVPQGAHVLWPDGAPAGATPAPMELTPAARAGGRRCGMWAGLRLCFD